MREIKFRGRSLYDEKQWVYGLVFKSGSEGQWTEIQTANGATCYVDPETIGQCTGLKDKNGVEIYEGDVLEAEHKLKTQKFKRKYQVIFNEKGYWDAISLDDKPVRLCYAGFDKCEVIGNIYENKELLGG